MSVAAQPLVRDDGPLSPWWIRGILIVMAIGFSGLAATTMLAYRDAPPIPARTVDPQGSTLFTAEDIREGQGGISQVRLDGQWQHLGARGLPGAELFR